MRSDRERAEKLLTLINKLSTAFGSMHWTLLRFDEPLLATSDQPVCGVPLLGDGKIRPISATLNDGWSETMEVRFALGPRLLWLGSWHMGPEAATIAGTWAHALDHNVAVTAQADLQWFHDPARPPALPARIFAVLEHGHTCSSL